MPPVRVHLPADASSPPGAARRVVSSALEIPTDRPDFIIVYPQADVVPPASAVPSITLPSELRTTRPDKVRLYLDLKPDPELLLESRCIAYAYITPAPGAGGAPPEPFVRAAMRAAALDLDLEVRPSHFPLGDLTLQFRSPEDREVAMGKQPFLLDGGSVKLMREGETPNVRRITMDYLAHVVLLDYPVEQRTEESIRFNSSRFGFIKEIDPACYTAPDLSPVHLIVNLSHPREIPRELRLEYLMYGSRNVLPVEILRVWNLSESLDANGGYVPLFGCQPQVQGHDPHLLLHGWMHADAACHCFKK